MKRCEKDAIKEIAKICKEFNIEMLDMFKLFDIIDKDTTKVNNTIAKVRKLVSILLVKYKYWDYGLQVELSNRLNK